MGTPELAAAHLQALLQSQHQVVAVWSQPPRRAGRGKQLQPSDVHKVADSTKLVCHTPTSLGDEDAQRTIALYELDLLVVVAYGLILPKAVLDLPRLGAINVHASKLPRHRGASPIQAAILAGDHETAVDIMQMDVGLDTGPVIHRKVISLDPRETAGSLHDKIVDLGPAIMLEAINAVADGEVTAMAQDDAKATYCGKIDKKDSVINWSEEATRIDRKVRAYHPWPLARTQHRDQLLLIHQGCAVPTIHSECVIGEVIALQEGIEVMTADGLYRIERLQRPGKAVITAQEFLRGYDLKVGDQLGES